MLAVSHSTTETVSPTRSEPAIARQVSLSISIGSPPIDPEVSSTRVMFIAGRSSAVIVSLLTASCSR